MSSISGASSPGHSKQGTPVSGMYISYCALNCTIATRRKLSFNRSTSAPQKREEPAATQTSEYIPSQFLPVDEKADSPTLRNRGGKKRKSSFEVIIPSNPRSETPSSSLLPRSDQAKEGEQSTLQPNLETVEDSVDHGRASKKKKLTEKVIEDSQPEIVTKATTPELSLVVESRPSRVQTPLEAKETLVRQQTPRSIAKESSFRRSSRSRQSTPRHPAKNRDRSISPITKVDSWLTFPSDNDESAFVQTEKSLPPQPDRQSHATAIAHNSSRESPMNPVQVQVPASDDQNLNQVQIIHRQLSQTQSIASPARSQSPPVSVLGSRSGRRSVRKAF